MRSSFLARFVPITSRFADNIEDPTGMRPSILSTIKDLGMLAFLGWGSENLSRVRSLYGPLPCHRHQNQNPFTYVRVRSYMYMYVDL